jgi:mannose-6-phosphate isomerase-like protein (cupin superfamily)
VNNHPTDGEPSTQKPIVRIAQLDEIPAVPCPCGEARRAFHAPDNHLATVHLTDISKDSRAHYHKKMTEFYIVLEGSGVLEADGVSYPLKPLTAVMIPPGCVHRAVGNLRIINVPMPPFDPADEYEPEAGEGLELAADKLPGSPRAH